MNHIRVHGEIGVCTRVGKERSYGLSELKLQRLGCFEKKNEDLNMCGRWILLLES